RRSFREGVQSLGNASGSPGRASSPVPSSFPAWAAGSDLAPCPPGLPRLHRACPSASLDEVALRRVQARPASYSLVTRDGTAGAAGSATRARHGTANAYNAPPMDREARIARRHHLEHPKRLDGVRASDRTI